jgi:hypothetical protein
VGPAGDLVNRFSDWPYTRRSVWVEAQRRIVASYFNKRGVRTSGEGYILDDRHEWERNLVDATLKDWLLELQKQRRETRRVFPIHKWIHHGLSSQALLINLLGPVIRGKQWLIFDEILKRAGLSLSGRVKNVDLEQEDRNVFNEQSGQPTSFDLACETDTAEKIFVEFKFTEAEFGGCSLFKDGDCDGANAAANHSLCYLHHIDRGYWKAMDRHELTGTVLSDTTCPFAELYQAYRELLFALETAVATC